MTIKQIILLFTLYVLYLPLCGQDSISIITESDTIIQFPLTSECISDGLPLQYSYPYEITEQNDNNTTAVITISKNCGQTTTIDLERRNDSIFIVQSDVGELTTCGCFQHFELIATNLSSNIYISIKKIPYTPFATEKVNWIELKEIGDDLTPPTKSIETYFLDSDTTITEKSYTKIYRKNDEGINFIGGFREDNKQIYYIGYDYHWQSTNGEVLLYDFDLAIGDTVYTRTWQWNTVESIDSILVEEKYRNRYNLNDGQEWIEGIGSTYGFLYPMTDIPTSYWRSELICFKKNEDVIYWNTNFPNDYLYTSSEKQYSIRNKAKVFPNYIESNAAIQVTSKIAIKSIELLDISGRHIKSFFLEKRIPNEIVIPAGLSGMYLLNIENIEGDITTKKIFIK